MKVLVTGGAGFIGSHLVERLLADGHEVAAIDNFSTGRRENLSKHENNPKLRIIENDIREIESIAPYFKEASWVFHLAALPDIVPSISRPMDYLSSNVTGMANVLECSRRNKVRRFIYAASSSCYGIPAQFPTPESAPIRCEYPYALTKYLGEQCALHWGKVYGLPVVSLRFFNVYGPRVRTNGTYGAVFGVFLAQLANKKPLTIIGDGNQTRDFTFVSDAVEAFITAARSDVSGEIFNVGSGGTYSVNTLAEHLGGEKVYVPKRPGEPDCTFADISKIRQRLGWTPRVGFREGVEIMKQHLGEWQAAPIWTESSIQEATKEWFQYLRK